MAVPMCGHGEASCSTDDNRQPSSQGASPQPHACARSMGTRARMRRGVVLSRPLAVRFVIGPEEPCLGHGAA
jgi:hypothetical protein